MRLRHRGHSIRDAVLEVRYAARLNRADFLELQMRSHSVEEARASAQEHRRDVQLQLVHQNPPPGTG